MSTLSKAKNGDEEAFSILMEEYKLPMYKTAKAILNNEDDVCDAIQEALISIYRGLNSLKHEEYLKTWIIRITINKCYDVISKGNKDNNENNKEIVTKVTTKKVFEKPTVEEVRAYCRERNNGINADSFVDFYE